MSSVRVLYDFTAEDVNELSVMTGETLSVLNPNMFDGWIQVRNSRGQQGIVPLTYVEYTSAHDDDDIPPPPSSSSFGYSTAASNAGDRTSATPSWNLPTPAPTYVNANPTSSYLDSSYQSQAFNSFAGDKKNPPGQGRTTASSNRAMDDDDSDSFSDGETPTPASGASSSNAMQRNNSATMNPPNMLSSTGTIGKSSKVKNTYGLDAFLLRGAIKTVLDCDRISSIVLNEQRMPVWRRQSPPYQVVILGYHADKKYHGVKKFTSYEIQAKIFPQKVNRRYNHFDWLHERLIEKYPNLCIPPLPGKAVTGNFEDDFIAKRKSQLELWLNRMAAHPVIGQSEVFIHFLQSEENSAKWKAGKRKAEKDEYRGAQWFCTLTVPAESVDTPPGIRERVDKFAKATTMLDNGVKNVMVALDKIATLNSATYKKEFNMLGKKLEEFGLYLSNDALDAPNNSQLSTAIITAGNTYNQIGNIFGEQAKLDTNPLLDRLILYRGIIQQMPDIVNFEKSSLASFEEFQQRPEKLEGRTLIEIAPRREIISHVTFAEMNLFNREKVDDLAIYFKNFLQQQIQFYTEITECLKRAHANFERIPITSPSYTGNPAGASTRR